MIPNDSSFDPCVPVRRFGGNFKIDKINPRDMINQKRKEEQKWKSHTGQNMEKLSKSAQG